MASAEFELAFLDSNIWLYAFNIGKEIEKHRAALGLIRDTPRIVISPQVINEVSLNMLRKFSARESDVRNLIGAFHRKYLVVECDEAVSLKASELRSGYSFSFWDSLIVASAMHAGASRLYSEDMQDGLKIGNDFTIRNPLKK